MHFGCTPCYSSPNLSIGRDFGVAATSAAIFNKNRSPLEATSGEVGAIFKSVVDRTTSHAHTTAFKKLNIVGATSDFQQATIIRSVDFLFASAWLASSKCLEVNNSLDIGTSLDLEHPLNARDITNQLKPQTDKTNSFWMKPDVYTIC